MYWLLEAIHQCTRARMTHQPDVCGQHRITSSQQGKLYRPSGICIDFANTVYITCYNDCVSRYMSKGQFIKSFDSFGKGDGNLSNLKGVAVDNTGTLYVCDCNNDHVVVY